MIASHYKLSQNTYKGSPKYPAPYKEQYNAWQSMITDMQRIQKK